MRPSSSQAVSRGEKKSSASEAATARAEQLRKAFAAGWAQELCIAGKLSTPPAKPTQLNILSAQGDLRSILGLNGLALQKQKKNGKKNKINIILRKKKQNR